ncbi:hypothetical protein P154DRAFT_557650 [Amniculicola lignicola CBS 123094]|uniref:Uncharacterized protein n=1 Tax=Amniculicola lignicola CBS 123094 TaxID=1392246 RepID=A0A6A5VUV8_9PLEO|nr:hypothetical protein P154DRAFT_557650 [Amniculicola lignicola CBS 123094]
MANPSTNTLTYGHFGQAIYDLDNSSWSFARQPSHTGEIRQFTTWRTTIWPSKRFQEASETELRRSIYQSKQAATTLGQTETTLVPYLGKIHELSRTSAAVLSSLDMYDPAVGDLISFGTIAPEGRYKNPRRIVAVPTGECGNILRLTLLTKERYGWETNKSPYLEGEGITGTESGYAIWGVMAIQQICFSQTENKSMFLAVRSSAGTSLFRPTQRDRAAAPPRSAYYQLPASKIDPGPVSSISIHETGGTPHANVVFNPEYQRQLGIVDQCGNWSVWDIDRGERSGGYRLSCTCRSTIDVADSDAASEPVTTRDDGWARIMWVGDVNTILVCTRRNMEIFDIRGKSPTLLNCAEVLPKRSADWILDVKRHPTNKHNFFVLTSTQLVLMAVFCHNDVLGNANIEAGAIILLSWAHFRGTEDFTLQICVPAVTEEESIVFVSSRLNHLINVFRFAVSDNDTSLPLSSVDPVTLVIEDDLFSTKAGSRHIVSMHVQPLPFGEDDSSYNSGPGYKYQSCGLKFYRLTVVTSDLGVHDTLISAYDLGKEFTQPMEMLILPTNWHLVFRPRQEREAVTMTDVRDDFVEVDGLNAAFDPHLKKPFRPPRFRRGRNEGGESEMEDQSLMYRALSNLDKMDECNLGEDQDFSVLAQGIKGLLLVDAATVEGIPLGTMSEFGGMKTKVADVDEASSILQELLIHDSESSLLELRQLAPGLYLHSIDAHGQEPTISQLYDNILQHYIAPLPATISNRLRQKKEWCARRIATDVILADIRVRLKQPNQSSEEFAGSQLVNSSQPRNSQDSGAALSMRSSSKVKERGDSQNQPFSPSSVMWSQSSLPTPEPTPSIASGTAHPDHPSASTPLSRLSQHLQITKPLPTVPSNLNKVLMHWNMNSDPSTYDWDATTRAQEELFGTAEDQETVEDIESRESRQLKAKRKEERRAKRQKREQELFKRQAESQPTVLRSSPGPMFGLGFGYSSQTLSQSQSQAKRQGGAFGGKEFVQSQVEPGRHGGRPGKAKKKGRLLHYTIVKMSGFPTLQPAFIVRVDIDAPLGVGGQTGPALAIVPMVSGTVKSEPGFEPKLDAELHGVGYDYIHNDADGGHMRLDVRSQVKNSDGTIFAMYYKGTVALTAGVKAILGGSEDAKTTEFGDSFVTFSFETGDKKHKDLENGLYVAAGRFIFEKGKKVVVEYRVSKVGFGN